MKFNGNFLQTDKSDPGSALYSYPMKNEYNLFSLLQEALDNGYTSLVDVGDYYFTLNNKDGAEVVIEVTED